MRSASRHSNKRPEVGAQNVAKKPVKEISLDDLLASKSGPTHHRPMTSHGYGSMLPRSANLGRARPVIAAPPTKVSLEKKFQEPKAKPAKNSQARESPSKDLNKSKSRGKTREAAPSRAVTSSQRSNTPSKISQKVTRTPVKRQSASVSKTTRSSSKKSLVLGKRKAQVSATKSGSKRTASAAKKERSSTRVSTSRSTTTRKRDVKAVSKTTLALKKAKLKESIVSATAKKASGSSSSVKKSKNQASRSSSVKKSSSTSKVTKKVSAPKSRSISKAKTPTKATSKATTTPKGNRSSPNKPRAISTHRKTHTVASQIRNRGKSSTPKRTNSRAKPTSRSVSKANPMQAKPNKSTASKRATGQITKGSSRTNRESQASLVDNAKVTSSRKGKAQPAARSSSRAKVAIKLRPVSQNKKSKKSARKSSLREQVQLESDDQSDFDRDHQFEQKLTTKKGKASRKRQTIASPRKISPHKKAAQADGTETESEQSYDSAIMVELPGTQHVPFRRNDGSFDGVEGFSDQDDKHSQQNQEEPSQASVDSLQAFAKRHVASRPTTRQSPSKDSAIERRRSPAHSSEDDNEMTYQAPQGFYTQPCEPTYPDGFSEEEYEPTVGADLDNSQAEGDAKMQDQTDSEKEQSQEEDKEQRYVSVRTRKRKLMAVSDSDEEQAENEQSVAFNDGEPDLENMDYPSEEEQGDQPMQAETKPREEDIDMLFGQVPKQRSVSPYKLQQQPIQSQERIPSQIEESSVIKEQPQQLIEHVVETDRNTDQIAAMNEQTPTAMQQAPVQEEQQKYQTPESSHKSDDESQSSSDEEMSPSKCMLMHRRSDEMIVMRLSRQMARDYTRAKKQIRHYSPDQSNRHVRYLQSKQHLIGKKTEDEDPSHADQIVLDDDSENAKSLLEFNVQPKFRSAMNSRYSDHEREQLQQMVANLQEAENNLVLRNEATMTVQSAYTKAAEGVGSPMEQSDVDMADASQMCDKIVNLPLPSHLNHMMKLFEQFELNFRLLRGRHEMWTTSLEQLTTMIEGSYNRSFKESHFRQFLTVVPSFFLHKWEMKKGRLQLLIEIPANVCQQMQDDKDGQPLRTSNDFDAFHRSAIPGSVADWRLKHFRKQMYMLTYQRFLMDRDQIKQESQELYESLGLDTLDNDELAQMNQWPDFFQVDDIPPVRKSDLKPKPKVGGFKSMSNLLESYNIHSETERRMSEYDSQSQGGGVGSSGMASVGKVRSASVCDRDEAMLAEKSSDYQQSEFECLSQHGISAETFNLIQTKERIEDEAKQRNLQSLERENEKRELQEHLRVAETLRTIIKDHSSRVLYLDDAIEKLQSRIYGQFIEFKELRRLIVSITKILPEWCRVVVMPKTTLLRFDGKDRVQIGHIKQTIQNHFEKRPVAN